MPDQSSFKRFTNTDVRVKITDIGASFLGDAEGPPYTKLLQAGEADIIGFEPRADACADLNTRKGPFETYLPHAVGDGKQHTLRVCQAPGMSSLLEPNPEVLKLFPMFLTWGMVLSTMEIDTVRLDDIPETTGIDMIKIDIQGAELMVMQNAVNRLKDVLVIQTEVEFLPMYIGQPLFADVDLFLRAQGFVFHRFFPLVSRAIVPMLYNNDIYKGISQLLWADAIFVRDFTKPALFSDAQLLKTALLMHECYQSIDLAYHLLMEYDRRNGTGLAESYIGGMIEERRVASAAAAA